MIGVRFWRDVIILHFRLGSWFYWRWRRGSKNLPRLSRACRAEKRACPALDQRRGQAV